MSNVSEKPAAEIAGAQPGPRWTWLALVLAVTLVAWAVYYFAYYRKPVSNLDSFAQCLSHQGAKMYGAWWCPHCAEQKELFGYAFRYVNYVECSPHGQRTQNDVCKQAGIKNYPTWQFADGTQALGVLHLQALSEKTGCPLPLP
jgi:hypothetical protein